MSATVGLEQIGSLRRVYSRVPSLFFAFLDSSLDGESNGVLPASKLAEERAGCVFLQFDQVGAGRLGGDYAQLRIKTRSVF